jgi:hypothetical protein
MKISPLIVAVCMASPLFAQQVPKVFQGLLQPDVPVRGQIGMVEPPQEIDKFIAKVEAAARKDPEWFREHSKQAKPGVPLPFDERLGLTRAEYDEYLALWAKREFKPKEEVMLLLRQGSGNTWTISATGTASQLTTLRYSPDQDVFRSPSGELKRLEDIKADAQSILGAWSGHEWKFEEDTGLVKLKENLAIGQMEVGNFGLIVYRAQEISSEGTRLLDKSLVIRFPLTKENPKSEEPKKNSKSSGRKSGTATQNR